MKDISLFEALSMSGYTGKVSPQTARKKVPWQKHFNDGEFTPQLLLFLAITDEANITGWLTREEAIVINGIMSNLCARVRSRSRDTLVMQELAKQATEGIF